MNRRSITESAAPLLALSSAALFGASTPLAKLLLGGASPWMLAALLYVGAGVGLLLYWGLRASHRARGLHAQASAAPAEAPLRRSQLPVLAAVTACGGVMAPVLLLLGLQSSSAASTSLLLNLEGVFTLALARLVFHENLQLRVGVGAATILAAAVLLSWHGGAASFHWSTLAIGSACLAWALDNNLTRSLSMADPVQISMIKTLVAGLCNLALALASGVPFPAARTALAAALLGLFAYGLSVVLFVLALRALGTARTGAYFSVSSFVGAAIAVPLLGEPLTSPLIVAAGLMAVGLWLLVTERHEHLHEHLPLVHEHRHVHDLHHQHSHGPDDPAGEPHTHVHAHARLIHAHPHFPDIHHRHRHQRQRP